MSFDDIIDEKIPWLCDDCAEKGFRVIGFLALVKPCPKCKEEKCDHCFAPGDTDCEACMGKAPPPPPDL
jgi:hypothetical protein